MADKERETWSNRHLIDLVNTPDGALRAFWSSSSSGRQSLNIRVWNFKASGELSPSTHGVMVPADRLESLAEAVALAIKDRDAGLK